MIEDVKVLSRNFEVLERDLPELHFGALFWAYMLYKPELPILHNANGHDCLKVHLLEPGMMGSTAIVKLTGSDNDKDIPTNAVYYVFGEFREQCEFEIALNRFKELGRQAEWGRGLVGITPDYTVEDFTRWVLYVKEWVKPEHKVDFDFALYDNSWGETYRNIPCLPPLWTSINNIIGESRRACEEMLKDLISGKDSPNGQNQRRPGSDVIEIESDHFNKNNNWRLLEAIVSDSTRVGVPCPNDRSLRSLRERLQKKAGDPSKAGYKTLADSLKWDKGLAYSSIPFGTIKILPTEKKNGKK